MGGVRVPSQLTRHTGPGSDPDAQDYVLAGSGPCWITYGGLSISISRVNRTVTVSVMEHGKEGEGDPIEDSITRVDTSLRKHRKARAP